MLHAIYFISLCRLFAALPKCRKSELKDFPLRMRSWLKNVYLQLYDEDEAISGLGFKHRNPVSFSLLYCGTVVIANIYSNAIGYYFLHRLECFSFKQSCILVMFETFSAIQLLLIRLHKR